MGSRSPLFRSIVACSAALRPLLCCLQAYLDPENIPRGADSLCGFCHEPLDFLLQVEREGVRERERDRWRERESEREREGGREGGSDCERECGILCSGLLTR